MVMFHSFWYVYQRVMAISLSSKGSPSLGPELLIPGHPQHITKQHEAETHITILRIMEYISKVFQLFLPLQVCLYMSVSL